MSYYASFQGRVYLGERNINGEPINVRSPGNVADLSLSLKTDVIEHYESQTGQRAVDLRLVQGVLGFAGCLASKEVGEEHVGDVGLELVQLHLIQEQVELRRNRGLVGLRVVRLLVPIHRILEAPHREAETAVDGDALGDGSHGGFSFQLILDERTGVAVPPATPVPVPHQ